MSSRAEPSKGLVAAVDRALSLLRAFQDGDLVVSLADLAKRTGLYKSTCLRLLQTLEAQAFVLRLPDGGYRLGPATFRLGMLYQSSFRLEDVLLPVLEDLATATGESASFFVLDGETRTCLFRVDSKQPVRHTVQVGQSLPARRGATGRVLAEFSAGALATDPERFHRLPVTSVGKDALDVSVVSGPVFGAHGELRGAISISGPTTRFDEAARRRAGPILMTELARLTKQLGGPGNAFPREAEAPMRRLS